MEVGGAKVVGIGAGVTGAGASDGVVTRSVVVAGGGEEGPTSGTLGLWRAVKNTRPATTTTRIVIKIPRSDTRFFNFAMFVFRPMGIGH